MSDQAVVFGTYHNLVGTLAGVECQEGGDSYRDSSASGGSNAAGRADVAAIFVTPGMLHHAGPFRIHQAMASTLAEAGIPSLRFDLSGIGESFGVGVPGRSIDRAANEVSQAMDFLAREHGIEKFVLFGLCSGADDSVHTAVNDARVVGVVAMDGCGYRTTKFYWNRVRKHYLPRICSLAKWSGLLARWFDRDGAETPSSLQMGSDVREFPPLEQATDEFQRLADRQVRMHFVYTGGIADYYNYEGQFFEMFAGVRWNGRATTSYFPEMDHVALLCEDRERIVADVTDFIQRVAVADQPSETEVTQEFACAR